jgi:HK97 family phage major capsid protein
LRAGSYFKLLKEQFETRATSSYLVPELLSSTMIRLIEVVGVFRCEARVFNMKSDVLYVPRRTAGVGASFITSDMSITTVALDNISLTAKKVAALVLAPNELVEDSLPIGPSL